jgi:hypothetical protein
MKLCCFVSAMAFVVLLPDCQFLILVIYIVVVYTGEGYFRYGRAPSPQAFTGATAKFNRLALVSICEIDVTSFSEYGRGVKWFYYLFKKFLVSDWLTANCEIVISTQWLTKNGFFTFILAK